MKNREELLKRFTELDFEEVEVKGLTNLDSNINIGNYGFYLDYWEEENTYVVQYGDILGDYTEFNNVMFFETLEQANKFIKERNLKGREEEWNI